MKHFLYLNFLFLLFSTTSYDLQSQTSFSSHLVRPEFIVPKTAKSLLDFKTANVDFGSGTANIEVPLASISDGPIVQPITISYNTGGIKVDDEASWVGLGWNLNSSPFITREVRGIPDENFKNQITNITGGGQTNLAWMQYIQSKCSNPYSLIHPTSLTNINGFHHFYYLEMPHLSPCGGGTMPPRDVEPDLYTLYINGAVVKFIFDYNLNPKILNNNFNYKIITVSGTAFTILDESGNKYYFSEANSEKLFMYNRSISKYTTPSVLTYLNLNCLGGTYYGDYHDINGCQSFDVIGTIGSLVRYRWNITKIESPDTKYKLDYTYDNYEYGVFNYNLLYPLDKTSLTPLTYGCPSNAPLLNLNAGIGLQQDYIGYKAKRIKEIKSSTGSVLFEANTIRDDNYTSGISASLLPKALDYIKVFNTDNIEIKRVKLNYSYFISATTDAGFPFRSKRLKLNSVVEYGSDLISSKPGHLFDYDATNLPLKYSYEQDFWGYYLANGATSMQGTQYFYPNYNNSNLNDNVLWTQTCIYPISLTGSGSPITLPGVNRLPNINNTKAAALTKVTYPTGGYQTFDYELNTFCLDIDLTNRIAGGLRLKSLIISDGVNSSKNMVTNYYYDHNSIFLAGSTKRSSGKINFLPSFGREGVDIYVTDQFEHYKVHSHSYASSVETSQSKVAYTEVKEEQVGKGYAVYKYENAGSSGKNQDVQVSGTWLIEKTKTEPITACKLPSGNVLNNNSTIYKHANYPYSKEPNTDWFNGNLKEMEAFDINGNLLYKKTNDYTIKNYEKLVFYSIAPGLYTSTNGLNYEYHSFEVLKYYYLSAWRVLSRETEYLFNPSSPGNVSNAEVKITDYAYTSATHKFLTAKVSTESNGRTLTENYKYSADFNLPNAQSLAPDQKSQALLNMNKINFLSAPVEKTILQTKSSVTEVLSAKLFTYKDLNNFVFSGFQTTNPPLVREFESFNLEIPTPLALSSFNPANLNQVSNNVTFASDSRYLRETTNQLFDSKGNLIQSKIENGPETSWIFGYNKMYPIAEVLNAKNSEIAHTSFESEEVTAWAHTPANIVSTDKKTGDKCYSITPAPSPNGVGYDVILNKTPLNINQTGKYLFSCWIKTPAGFTNNSARITAISNDGINLSAGYPANQVSTYRTAFIENTNNIWVYYSVIIDLTQIRSAASLPPPPAGPYLGLRFFVENHNTTQGFLIDDIRIMPVNSFMSTSTVKPLIGVTSQTDNRNNCESYEYDIFGRPVITRDLNNNILEKTIYNYR